MKLFYATSTALLLFFLQVSFTKSNAIEKVYFQDQVIETDDFKATLTDIVATPAELKFKLVIENQSNNYLLFKPSECSVKTVVGAMSPSEKQLIVDPNSKGFRVLNFKAASLNELRDFVFQLKGVYAMNPDGDNAKMSTVKLNAVNEIKENGIKLTVANLKKESVETQVKFKVSYDGSKALLVSPSMITVKMPDGNSYANALRKEKPSILFKGDTDNLNCKWERMPGGSANDMQMVEMIVNFDQVFKEMSPVAIEAKEVAVAWNESLTIEKNK